MSTLSTPIPARPITLRLVAASMISLVTLVAERIARPSYRPITALSSSGVIPGLTSTSHPRSSKMRAALGSILSEMRTLGLVIVVLPLPFRGEGRVEGSLRPALIVDEKRGGIPLSQPSPPGGERAFDQFLSEAQAQSSH